MSMMLKKNSASAQIEKRAQTLEKMHESTSVSRDNHLTIHKMLENGHLSGRSGKEYILKVK